MDKDCCVFTRGDFYISDYTSGCSNGVQNCAADGKPLKKLGNVSSCVVTIESVNTGRENKFNPTCDDCPKIAITNMPISLSINCASSDNFLRALYAEKKVDESGEQVDTHCVSELSVNDFFRFSKYLASKDFVSVELIDEDDIVIKTLIEDIDYKYHKSGIEIISNTITIDDADRLRVSYDYNTENYFQMDFGSKKIGYKSLFFKGTNYASAEGDKILDVILYKVLLNPISQFDIITKDDFFTINLSGVVEKDRSSGKHFSMIKEE